MICLTSMVRIILLLMQIRIHFIWKCACQNLNVLNVFGVFPWGLVFTAPFFSLCRMTINRRALHSHWYPLIYNCDLKSWKKKVEKKSWKMERLNFENLGFAKMKKNFDFSFRLLFEMISQLNSIHPYIRISDSTTSSFFLKAITVTWNVTANELRSLSFFWKIPLQAFRIQSCMYKSFWRLHPSFENKKGRMKNGLQWLHSTLSSLSYVF